MKSFNIIIAVGITVWIHVKQQINLNPVLWTAPLSDGIGQSGSKKCDKMGNRKK